MPEFELTVEFEVFCAKCGEGLCNQSTTGKTLRRSHNYVQVSPCEKCLEDVRDNGYEKGYEHGFDAAKGDPCTC